MCATIIYKISKKDEKMNYIGSTKNLNKRIYKHRYLCNLKCTRPIYTFINDHGGFDSWEVSTLATLYDETINPAIIEQQYIGDNLEYQLNAINAYVSPETRQRNTIKYRKKYNQIRYDCKCGEKGLTWKNRIQHEYSNKHIIKMAKININNLSIVEFN